MVIFSLKVIGLDWQIYLYQFSDSNLVEYYLIRLPAGRKKSQATVRTFFGIFLHMRTTRRKYVARRKLWKRRLQEFQNKVFLEVKVALVTIFVVVVINFSIPYLYRNISRANGTVPSMSPIQQCRQLFWFQTLRPVPPAPGWKTQWIIWRLPSARGGWWRRWPLPLEIVKMSLEGWISGRNIIFDVI